MNPDIKKLTELTNKKEKLIIGLMSGTSLDGLDVALCKIKNAGDQVSVNVLQFATVAYSQSEITDIEKVFANKNGKLEEVTLLNRMIANRHAAIVNELLQLWNIDKSSIDCIASHGQTIYHAPKSMGYPINTTLQIGDGDHLAAATGIITISDFRQKHVAAGGEGAPLALYGDVLLFANSQTNTVLLNIGGIANFTFISMDKKTIISTDCGPGNVLMNCYMKMHFNKPYDEYGKLAASGLINNPLLERLCEHPFFTAPLPKSTGAELFNVEWLQHALMNTDTKHCDVLATLNELTAMQIARCINNVCKDAFTLFISGGGKHNEQLVKNILLHLPHSTLKSNLPFDIPTDAKEAVIFAMLANETLSGNKEFWKKCGIKPAVNFGKISLPT